MHGQMPYHSSDSSCLGHPSLQVWACRMNYYLKCMIRPGVCSYNALVVSVTACPCAVPGPALSATALQQCSCIDFPAHCSVMVKK